MLEVLLNPKKAERMPWEMLFVGLLYASLSVLLVNWIFSGDAVLANYSGVLIVTFTVMFSLPFMYYLIKLEEKKDLEIKEEIGRLKQHSKALFALLWLFLGFVIAFSFWYVILDNPENFKAQIETFCLINQPSNYEQCASDLGIPKTTGFATAKEHFFAIFSNNIYVLIFTLIFSLIFGAGAIFILAWNASVIAAAVGIFAKQSLANLPLGIARYMIHGLPEIAAYFVGALAGGILGVAVIRDKKDFWEISKDSLNLIIIAVVILVIAAFIEVFITPGLF